MRLARRPYRGEFAWSRLRRRVAKWIGRNLAPLDNPP
jgi:hypothetical protein